MINLSSGTIDCKCRKQVIEEENIPENAVPPFNYFFTFFFSAGFGGGGGWGRWGGGGGHVWIVVSLYICSCAIEEQF